MINRDDRRRSLRIKRRWISADRVKVSLAEYQLGDERPTQFSQTDRRRLPSTFTYKMRDFCVDNRINLSYLIRGTLE